MTLLNSVEASPAPGGKSLRVYTCVGLKHHAYPRSTEKAYHFIKLKIIGFIWYLQGGETPLGRVSVRHKPSGARGLAQTRAHYSDDLRIREGFGAQFRVHDFGDPKTSHSVGAPLRIYREGGAALHCKASETRGLAPVKGHYPDG